MEVFDELVAPEYTHHDDPCSNAHTAAEFRDWIAGSRGLVPDLSLTIGDTITEGDRVAVRGTGRGTHTRAFWGLPANGKQWQYGWVYVARLKEDRIAEGWLNWDRMGLKLQIEGGA